MPTGQRATGTKLLSPVENRHFSDQFLDVSIHKVCKDNIQYGVDHTRKSFVSLILTICTQNKQTNKQNTTNVDLHCLTFLLRIILNL